MSEIVAGISVLKPSWDRCPKCNSEDVNVEETGHYSETFKYGVLIGRNVEFGKLGPTITSCLKCGYDDEEDVN